MGAELRIENDEVVRLAEELAALRHVSVPDAVAQALRERVEREREVQARIDRMLELGREIRSHMTEPVSSDHSWLYDENGLPA